MVCHLESTVVCRSAVLLLCMGAAHFRGDGLRGRPQRRAVDPDQRRRDPIARSTRPSTLHQKAAGGGDLECPPHPLVIIDLAHSVSTYVCMHLPATAMVNLLVDGLSCTEPDNILSAINTRPCQSQVMVVAWLIATIMFFLSYVSPCRHLPSEQVPPLWC